MTPAAITLLREAIALSRQPHMPIERLEAWSNWADEAEAEIKRHETNLKGVERVIPITKNGERSK